MFLVYVIDDDEAVRESLEALLTVEGYLVETFPSADAYVSDLGSRISHGACALLDVHMPGMSGLELLRVLSVHQVPLRVLLLTASEGEQLRELAIALGAVDCLVKPVPHAVLLDAIESIRTSSVAPS